MVLTACSQLPPRLAVASLINLRRVDSNKLMAFGSRHDYQLLSDAPIIILKPSVCWCGLCRVLLATVWGSTSCDWLFGACQAVANITR